jgi:hypothetical protein
MPRIEIDELALRYGLLRFRVLENVLGHRTVNIRRMSGVLTYEK